MRTRRCRHAAGLVSLLALGCAQPDTQPSVQAAADSTTHVMDDSGRALSTSTSRTSVVSMIPAVTDLLVHMGATDRLVARTRFDVAPSVIELPSIGGGIDPDMETLATLAPDLVVAWRDDDTRSAAGQAQTLGLMVYQADYQTLADVRRHAHNLGRLLGMSGSADSVVSALDLRLQNVRKRVAGADRVSVLYAVSEDPPMAAGAGTFVDSLIWTAGGRNVLSEVAGWPQVSFETLLDRRPQVVLLPTAEDAQAALQRLRSSPGWMQLPAVAEGRLLAVDPDLFGRPGPGLAEAAETLARSLHPTLWDDSPPGVGPP